MRQQRLHKPIEIWVKEDLSLPGIRPNILLMHQTSPDDHPELQYWNLLRHILPNLVTIRLFNKLTEAGSLVVMPNDYKDYLLAPQFQQVHKLKKQVLNSGRSFVTFTPGMEYKSMAGEIAFATSVYRHKKEKLIPIPTWLYDLGSKAYPIEKPNIPTVGFVGNTQYPGKLSSLFNFPLPKRAYSWLASSRFMNRHLTLGVRRGIGRLVRKRVLQEAQKAVNLQTSIISRNIGYFEMKNEQRKQARAEYIQSIQNNAYTLCMRGDNNDNYQIYEVMSAGRIPIFIDTNLRLPPLKKAKWEDFCVIIPFQEIHRLGEIVQEFHDRLSPSDFIAACQKSRAAFEELLPHNFIFSILQHIIDGTTASFQLGDRIPISTSSILSA